MMLLSLMGSPRKGRNTDRLLDSAGEAFVAEGGEVEKVYLHGANINPCTGCYACMSDLDEICAQRDGMDDLYAKLLGADALLWGTPIYMWSPTSQMKLLLDRLFPLGDYQATRWRCALNGKPVGLVIVYADPDPVASGIVHTHAVLDIVARASGGQVVGTVHSAVDDNAAPDQCGPLAHRAADLGRKLAAAARQWTKQRGAGP